MSSEREDKMSGQAVCVLSAEDAMAVVNNLETMLEIFMPQVAQFSALDFQRFLEAKNRIHQILSDRMRD